MSRPIAATLVALAVAACGGDQPEPTLRVEESSLIGIDDPAPPPEPACPGDAIARADLNAVLDAGPAPLLAAVETRARQRDGRFVGFEIVAFTRGEPPACPALRVGDVIAAVNGRAIERPEHLFEVFQALRGATAIEFELVRENARTTLRYVIVE